MARTTLSLLPEPPPDEMRAHARDRVSSVAASRTLLIWSRTFGRSTFPGRGGTPSRATSVPILDDHLSVVSPPQSLFFVRVLVPISRMEFFFSFFDLISHGASTSDAACSPATALRRARRILPRSRSWLPRSRRARVARGPATVA